jgi:hypothetical protein
VDSGTGIDGSDGCPGVYRVTDFVFELGGGNATGGAGAAFAFMVEL